MTGSARTAPLTGEECLESLRDGREVWIDGERWTGDTWLDVPGVG